MTFSRLLIICVLIISFCCRLDAQSNILDQRVTIKMEAVRLADVLKELESLTECRFTFNDNDLPAGVTAYVFEEQTVRLILDALLPPAGLAYQLRNRYVIILPASKLITEPEPVIRYTLSGFVRDAETGEALIGCTVFAEGTSFGCYANAYGFYSLSLPEGEYDINYSYIGYELKKLQIQLDTARKFNAELRFLEESLPDVVVSSKLSHPLLTSPGMSRNQISPSDTRLSPVLFGEPDIVRTIQLLPGVTSTGEGGGYSVRGSGSDHNLILLDEAPIYNPSHLLGIFSIFNTDAIRSVELIKGDMPAQHRGRLTSILDIRMKEGNNKEFHGSGGVGLIAARVALEGKMLKGKASYMAAYRRSYLDLLIKAATRNLRSDDGLYFSDLNLKANFQLGTDDRLYFSVYNGKDVFQAEGDGINWGNSTFTLRWNHLFNDKLFMNLTAVGSTYDFTSTTNIQQLFNDIVPDTNTQVRNTITDFTIKADFQYFQKPGVTMRFGVNTISHSFLPAAVIQKSADGTTQEDGTLQDAAEIGAYWSQEIALNDQLRLEYGLHFASFSALGTDNYVYDYNDFGKRIDSTFYEDRALIKNYAGFEPRLSATWHFKEKQSLKASYTRTRQYIQQLRSAFVNNPATIWIPANQIIQPQVADQFSIGYVNAIADGWEATAEVYFRDLKHQINYRDGARLGLTPRDVETLLVFGSTEAYGAEVMLNKTSGKLRGWLSYAYARSFSTFPEIDEGKRFRGEQDRPHDFAAVAIYDINAKYTLAANWVYFSGKLVTLPAGKFLIGDQYIDFYEERNNYRLPTHHRLDVSLTVKKKGKKNRTSSWNFAIYNLYARKNPTFVYFDQGSQNNSSKVTQLSLVNIVPSVTYNFEF